MVNLAALYTDLVEWIVHRARIAELADALDQGNSGAYVNFWVTKG
jgi:hypothetical protein